MQQLSPIRISQILPFKKSLNKIATKNILIFLTYFLLISNLIPTINSSDNNQNIENNNNNIKIVQENNNNKIKNILVIIFPGGKSHHFVMKKLFDFTLKQKNKSNFTYNFHILVHNYDKDFWEGAPENYKIYGFGDIKKFDIIFNKSLEKVREDPIFGYDSFSKAMIHIIEEFASSKLFNVLEKLNFDMIITDIPNCIFKFLKDNLGIKLALYLSPPAVPNLFYGLLEINPVTLPALGSPFTDKLSFFQRVQNFFFVYGFETMGFKFMREQMNVFRQKGYKLDTNNFFVYDALIMIQFPIGFAFNVSRPPNVIFLNHITPMEPQKLENDKSESELNKFLNIHKKNIYMSQGTIFKNIDFKRIIKIFEELSDIGFVLSIKKEVSDLYQFPKNVHLKKWVNQNNLLGDKRIHGFVSHGGINSILEAIYHKKPVVALGVALDQVNTAGMVKTRETGISFFSQNEITPENLRSAIRDILEDNNKYLRNTLKISEVINMNKPATEEFAFWLEYGFNFGYDHLIIKAYSHLETFQFYNLDIIMLLICLLFIIFWLIKKVLKRIFSLFGFGKNKDIDNEKKNN